MSRRNSTRADRVKSVLLALILIGIVGYFALTSIPSAERPTLRAPTSSSSSGAGVVPSRTP